MRDNDLILLKDKLNEIKSQGWIENRRRGNAGGIGNTLEDLLEVAENNLQLPDFGDWEIKSQRAQTSSLLTLFHSEPKPRTARFVPQILLPLYGWPHQEAGTTYPSTEMSFRQTINNTSYSNRGFKVNVGHSAEQIYITFDSSKIDLRHTEWKQQVESRVGLGSMSPAPYWDFEDITEKLKTKLNNLMYVKAETEKRNGTEYFKYDSFEVYMDPSLERFISLVEAGSIYIDFDARTGHNHGTKMRIRPRQKTELYAIKLEI